MQMDSAPKANSKEEETEGFFISGGAGVGNKRAELE